MAQAKQKNGAVSAGGSSQGGGLAITEPQRGLCGAEDDLWALEGQQAAIMLPWHLFKLPPHPTLTTTPLLEMFSFFSRWGGLEFEADVQRH